MASDLRKRPMSKPQVKTSGWHRTTEKLPTRTKSCHACRETVITGKDDIVRLPQHPKVARLGIVTQRRRFNRRERAALYIAADGKCALCGRSLLPSWHGDHKNPYSRGGSTDIINGQALCPECNLKKGPK